MFMMLYLLTLAICIYSLGVQGRIDRKCLDCMCKVESNCNYNIGCHPDGGSDSCGGLQIKNIYWIDCGRPMGDWKKCAANKQCSENCAIKYLDRYTSLCVGRTPTCQDYVRVHNGGPNGCKFPGTNAYWEKIRACYIK